MFKLSANSLYFDVSLPQTGLAHQGISPKGASDRLSFSTAYILLGEPKDFKAVEILYTKNIRFDQDLLITLVGASSSHLHLEQLQNSSELTPATVYKVQKGDILHIGAYTKGAKLYLLATPYKEKNKYREGLQRGAFDAWFSPPSTHMRFFKGPEYEMLQSDFFASRWHISNESDLMGLRLEGERLKANAYDIISSAVTEGTVQLSEKGPIVLMSHHQTTGGYPRILQLSAVDINTLAQYPLGSCFNTELITIEYAKELFLKQCYALEKFRNAFL